MKPVGVFAAAMELTMAMKLAVSKESAMSLEAMPSIVELRFRNYHKNARHRKVDDHRMGKYALALSLT